MQAISKSNAGVLKTVFAMIVTIVCITLLWQQIAAVPLQDIITTFNAIGFGQWTGAAIATFASFMAVGRYDAVWHAALKTNIAPRHARRTGMAAIAIGQAIGAGAITGAFVRWHLLPQLGLKTTTGVTVAVSLSFLACWAVLGVYAGVSLGLLPTMTVIVMTIIILTAVLVLPRYIALTSSDMWRLMSLTLLDVTFAGLALWILIPNASLGVILPVLAAYVLALGAGLISNAPGGLGAFDLCLVGLLHMVPEADLLAAILAFRIVYYVIPAVMAGVMMVAANLRRTHDNGTTQSPVSDLCHQGAVLHTVGTDQWVIQSHLLGTVAIEPKGCTPYLSHFTRHRFGFHGLYKADKALALQARNHGWTVCRIADDAVIRPKDWQLTGPQKRQLRRKLAQADKAGVRVTRAQGALPLDDMASISQDWAASHGGELGYSMGRYCPDYIAHQAVYLIWTGATLAGFITVQRRAACWAIDVIRHTDNMPCGAMHAAYTQVIQDANAKDVQVLSLGAVPTAAPSNRCQHWARSQKAGLIQFKQSFRPHWQPLYHAAPTRLQWIVSLAHVICHIQRPVPRLIHGILNRLIIISPFFHLNRSRARDMSAADFARLRTTKGGPHDQYIRKPAG